MSYLYPYCTRYVSCIVCLASLNFYVVGEIAFPGCSPQEAIWTVLPKFRQLMTVHSLNVLIMLLTLYYIDYELVINARNILID